LRVLGFGKGVPHFVVNLKQEERQGKPAQDVHQVVVMGIHGRPRDQDHVEQSKFPPTVGNPGSVQEYDKRKGGMEGGERTVGYRSVRVNLSEERLFDQRVYTLEPGFVVRVTDQMTIGIIDR